MEIPLLTPPKLTRQKACCFELPSFVCDVCDSIMKTDTCDTCCSRNLCPYCHMKYHYCNYCVHVRMCLDKDPLKVFHYLDYQNVTNDIKRLNTKQPPDGFELNFPKIYDRLRIERVLFDHMLLTNQP